MVDIAITDLINPPTADQIYDDVVDRLEAVKIPAKSWRQGGVARSVLGALCTVGAQGARVVADCVAAFYLSFAKGKGLTVHAKDEFDVDRIPATYASGKLTLTNSGGAIYTIGANEFIARVSTNQAKRYRVPSAFVLGANTSITVDAEAIDAGSASSAAPGEIDDAETPLAKVTVTNAASFIGNDEESDENLVKRCKASRGTWSPFGPRDAYEYAALSATLTDGSPTSITRVAVSRASSTGIVTVTCATASGTPSAAELAAVTKNCKDKAQTGTASLVVQGAVPKNTASTIIVWCKGGDAATIKARAQAALDKLIATYPIGGVAKTEGGTGYLYADRIATAIIASSPEIFDVDGPADVALAANEVAVDASTLDVRIT